MVEGDGVGKRVSWVELYFDLIFVFAVGQTAHVIMEQPAWSGLASALGLFAALWWTWIGFVVLYNRHGEDRPSRRLFVLAGTLPCAVAAIELQGAPRGDSAGFALALAAARLVLAVAYPLAERTSAVARRAGTGYGLSTVVFAVSAFVPGPWRFVLWGLALLQEAGFLLLADPKRRRAARERRRGRARERRPSRGEMMKVALTEPPDPDQRIDTAHLAERFGLFMIILLGEIVVSVGVASLGLSQRSLTFWLGLLGGLVLAAALWWIYFDTAAHINEYVLRASGGNPTFAYGIYAGGHLSPAFALLAIAAGVNLSLHEHPPNVAAWLVSGGLAVYLIGTRAFLTTGHAALGRVLRMLTLATTVCLGFLARTLPPANVVAVVSLWAVGVAIVVSRRQPRLLQRVIDDPLALFRTD